MDKETAFKKIIHFCEYQERSRLEVRDRLEEWGVETSMILLILDELERSNFINEERFSREYAYGKFKAKGWGRIRIRQGLLRKGVSEDLIEVGLKEINEEDYISKLHSLIEKKLEIEDNPYLLEKNHKVARYILSHGFEPELIWKILKHEEI